jgi:hypothetical protein
LFKMTNP